ncbi:phycobiliprotein lyase [Geitlerinema sp. PCC 9228]|jgi:hypothetical protein|uniref:phycobiliprotein lyase n=1 Tax=Geitlerinema sp. PCC 9228 TaxID=111611 RepID=UPI0008F9CA6E|nr:phycobiliprotein lyase [Geitlerinema sp. PCC 9228]
MDIQEFLQLCVGKWFVQRTSHQLPPQKLASSRGDFWIEWLSPEDDRVSQMCQKMQCDPTAALGGLKTSWETIVPGEVDKQKGSSAVVLLPDSSNSAQGNFIQQLGKPGASPVQGSYCLQGTNALTLETVADGGWRSEERIWFASDNLRLRTSTVDRGNGEKVMSFYSEIRMGGV